ncbi:MAG: hypothetical protein ACYC27_09900 [Armatimonadota bacterium]
MRHPYKFSIFLMIIALVILTASVTSAADKKMAGMVVGRTGEILHISVPQPVEDGAVLFINPIASEPPVAEVKVISCTKERPFIALAKLVHTDSVSSVPTGAKAYTNTNYVIKPDRSGAFIQTGSGDNGRFSIQAGSFRPTTANLRDTVADYWQSYRLDYSLIKSGGFDAMLSAEYIKGSGTFVTDQGKLKRTMEMFPLTAVGRIRPLRVGRTSLFMGAGGGMYRIRTQEDNGTTITTDTIDKFGSEYQLGLESRNGWIVELRYKDVKDTDIRGYSLGIGTKF